MTPPDPRRPPEDPTPPPPPIEVPDEAWSDDAGYELPPSDDDPGFPSREGGNLAGDSDEEL